MPMIESLSVERRIRLQLKAKSLNDLLELRRRLETADHTQTDFAKLVEEEIVSRVQS